MNVEQGRCDPFESEGDHYTDGCDDGNAETRERGAGVVSDQPKIRGAGGEQGGEYA
jgi:hypothetical protein